MRHVCFSLASYALIISRLQAREDIVYTGAYLTRMLTSAFPENFLHAIRNFPLFF